MAEDSSTAPATSNVPRPTIDNLRNRLASVAPDLDAKTFARCEHLLKRLLERDTDYVTDEGSGDEPSIAIFGPPTRPPPHGRGISPDVFAIPFSGACDRFTEDLFLHAWDTRMNGAVQDETDEKLVDEED